MFAIFSSVSSLASIHVDTPMPAHAFSLSLHVCTADTSETAPSFCPAAHSAAAQTWLRLPAKTSPRIQCHFVDVFVGLASSGISAEIVSVSGFTYTICQTVVCIGRAHAFRPF